jgi:hypothetical protein
MKMLGSEIRDGKMFGSGIKHSVSATLGWGNHTLLGKRDGDIIIIQMKRVRIRFTTFTIKSGMSRPTML